MRYGNDYDLRFRETAFDARIPYRQRYGAPRAERRDRSSGWGLGAVPGAYGTPLEPISPLEVDFGARPASRRPAMRSAGWTLRARDIMTENPEAVTPEATLQEVARRMRDLDVGIIPVISDPDRALLEGVVTDRDIAVRAVAEGRDMGEATVSEVMTRDVEAASEGAEIPELFAIMKREQVRRVPIVDEVGRLVGIVAQADLAVDYAGLDEVRGLQVGEVIERISEPAEPARWPGRGYDREPESRFGRAAFLDLEEEVRGRVRSGLRAVRRQARQLVRHDSDRDSC